MEIKTMKEVYISACLIVRPICCRTNFETNPTIYGKLNMHLYS